MRSNFRNTALSSLQGVSLAASSALSCKNYPRKYKSTFYQELVLLTRKALKNILMTELLNLRTGVIMMKNELTAEAIKYIIARVLDNAVDAFEEAKDNRGDLFYQGKKLAYYEVLDTIKNELSVREQDLKEFGLNESLENKFA